MTKDEAMQILAILKGAYPNSYRGVTEKEAHLTATVWAAQFAKYPAYIVNIAINKLISTNTYPPNINEVKDRVRSLYFEVWQELHDHKLYGGLDDRTVAIYKKMLEFLEPMRTGGTEPTLGELLKGYGNFLTGGNGTAQIE